MTPAPMLCVPLYRSYLWGGRNLGRLLRRELPPWDTVAESWEVSDVNGFLTPIESAPYEGMTLREVLARDAEAVLGPSGYHDNGERRFPLLVKYLDAQQVLSVQVHPDDAYAARHEDGSLGKTEMWLVLEAAPDAELIAGLRPGVTREDLRRAIREDRLPELLRRHRVRAGDVILMPAGRVHALGAGIIVAEIQQPSDVTYRLYDWGRLGPDGRPRPLHIERALEVIDFDDTDDPLLSPVIRDEPWGKAKLLAVTSYFFVEAWELTGSVQVRTDRVSPEVLMAVNGALHIHWTGGTLEVPYGRTAIVPAALDAYEVEPDGVCLVIRSRVPDLDGGLGEWTPRTPEEDERIRAVCDRKAAVRLFGGWR